MNILLSPKQILIAKILAVIFPIAFILTVFWYLFAPIDPFNGIHPSGEYIYTNFDPIPQYLYGLQLGLIVFTVIGSVYCGSIAILLFLKKMKITSIATPVYQYWYERWLGYLFVIFGLTYAFIPLYYSPTQIYLFPTLIMGSLIAVVGSFIAKTTILEEKRLQKELKKEPESKPVP